MLLMGFNCVFAQTADDFSDGDFTQNPIWKGDETAFFINTTKQLQTLLSATAKTVTLATENKFATNVKWEFLLQMDFDPSTTNQARIYLISNQQDLTGVLNGYFLQIGESGATDSYDLYRQSGSTISKIIDGPPITRGNINQVKARFEITRNFDGLFTLKADATGGNNIVNYGSFKDIVHTQSKYFGLNFKYTATRSNLFYFDDLKISRLEKDNIPPQITAIKALDSLSLQLTFSEPIEPLSAQNPSNFKVLNKNPVSITKQNDLNYLLTFNSFFADGNNTILLDSLFDIEGNLMLKTTLNFKYFTPYIAKTGDVLINEIFADPSPKIALPEAEFVELWNTTNKYIFLKNWKYSDLTTTYTFAKDSILPGEHLILCAKADTGLFNIYGRVIGLASWPSLNNSGDGLTLKNASETIIFQVNYLDSWYQDATKKAGGFSLELIDPFSTCKAIQNWLASTSETGGTPGKQNAIYLLNKNQKPLLISSFSLVDSLTLFIRFNRSIDSLSAESINNYTLNNGFAQPEKVAIKAGFPDEITLTYASALSRNKNYELSISEITDCGGYTLSNNKISFFYPAIALKNDVLVNEILFNPRADGVDFVEIYNNSDKTFDLKDLYISSLNDKDSLISIKKLSLENKLFLPKTILAFTTKPNNITTNYHSNNPQNIFQINSLPAFNNDEGVVVLLNHALQKTDQFNYSEKMHLSLINDVDGISLERTAFNKPTNAPGTFKSAASAVGFATPGDVNSQAEDLENLTEEVSLRSKTFSPDNDGFEDELFLDYHFPKPNYIANITIFDATGRLIKRLAKNETVATNGHWHWDGFNDNASIAGIGIYQVYIELFNEEGKVKKYRKTAVLARKLN